MDPISPEVRRALQAKDPHALAAAASLEQLEALKRSEDLIETDQRRLRTTSRFAVAAQVLVGWVAIAGFMVNAYQSYSNNQNQHRQAQIDQDRWSKEFERARQENKYRAFFETSVLATDNSNADKRLVGYALLQEFVSDPDYTAKAMLMLEESLSQELRSNVDRGIDDAHRNAVLAIVTALAETHDCRALARAAKSIDRIARRHRKFGDVVESSEVFRVYVFRLLGQAAQVCGSFDDFRAVRRPLRDTLLKLPDLGGLTPPLTPATGNRQVAELLRDQCLEDLQVNGASDCPAIFAGYAALCRKPEVPPAPAKPATKSEPRGDPRPHAGKAADTASAESHEAEADACALMQDVSVTYPVPASAPPPLDH